MHSAENTTSYINAEYLSSQFLGMPEYENKGWPADPRKTV